MTPADADFAARVRASFDRQRVMELLGARMMTVEPGVVEIALPFREDLTQQDGFLHAGVVTTIVDSACGYAAYTLMPAGAGVLTVEFKVNLLNPAQGVRFVARGEVVKPGRTLMVCTGEVTAERENGETRSVALMQATMIVMRDRNNLSN